MEINFDIRNTLVFIVTVLNLAIGILIFFRNRKNATNIYFFIFTLVVGLWGLSMVFYRSTNQLGLTEFFSRELYFWASLIPLSFIYFIYVFPAKEFMLSYWKKYVLPIPAICVAFFSLNSGYLIITVNYINTGEPQIVFNKSYYALYIIYMVVYFNYAYYLLFRKYFQKEKGPLRSQIGYVIVGTLLTTLIGTVTNLLGPYFDYFDLNWFGQVGLIVMVASIAYAILKYQLFNVKLILVELAVLLLNLFLFINIFTSHVTTSWVFNISISFLVLLFSIFLMRGIYKDIRDRERIEGLVKEMEVANEHLRVMEEQKTEFVSIASHQLRTPLTVIKGYASMILEGTFGPLGDEVRSAMEKLYKSSERIVALVEDLLLVSRLEQGRMPLTFEPVDLSDFIQKILAEEETAITEAGLDVSFNVKEDKEFWSLIDEKKFKQVVKHMLDNAIKYTKEPGMISVTLTEDLVAQKNYITISDTGIGMTREQIRAVFERFNLKGERSNIDSVLDLTNKDIDGKQVMPISAADNGEDEEEAEMLEKKTPGIGLYIAQEIIHAHKGSLRVESEGENRGTTMIIDIPRGIQE